MEKAAGCAFLRVKKQKNMFNLQNVYFFSALLKNIVGLCSKEMMYGRKIPLHIK